VESRVSRLTPDLPELVTEPVESPLARWGARLRDLWSDVKSIDTDMALQASMAGFIEAAAMRYAVDPGARWTPGEPLRLLFAGYAGTRNTGADVRVEEMVRQVRHLLGDDTAELSILTIDPALTRGYFRGVRQVVLPKVFPKFVFDAVHEQHGVIACEGSMFKSKFANALATLMVGALGVASAENKVAVGWGGEAGKMDSTLEAMVRRYCGDAFVLARNPESVDVLARLGVQARSGTDTAWTFEPAPPAVGRRLLENNGWDGHTPILALCPINPFWWPVKPDLARTAAWAATGAGEESHYASMYFHKSGADVDLAQRRYIASLAEGVRAFRGSHRVFPVVIGMEMLDRRACEQLAEALGGAPVLVSDRHDMYELVSALRHATALLSSRYHAIVCTMPAAIASVGVTMDERIRNLMADRGQPELALSVDQADLASAAASRLTSVWDRREQVGDEIERCVARNLVRMGQMGAWFVDHLRERHPELEIDPRFGGSGDPIAHLPPPGAAIASLLARHGDSLVEAA
jgi:polysaccharide pyruvyl transferase WcaK-like protein